MTTTEQKVKLIAKHALADYRLMTKGCERYLTDGVRRALVSDAIMSIMLTRYEVEEERTEHTNPNLYVDAARALWAELGL